MKRFDLPEELICEILLRLPVRALLRFKCVCKEWCALICSKRFIDGHFDHESNRDSLLFERYPLAIMSDIPMHTIYTYDGRHLRFDMPFITRNCELLGPANGIFCAVTTKLKLRRLFFINVATRKLKLLPPIPLRELKCLNFGFGFDSFSGEYKVVVFETRKNSQNLFCVYNSSSDSWRRKKVVDWLNERVNINMVDCGHFRNNVALINGVYYWLMNTIFIIGFDMRSENFHEILTPDATSFYLAITAYGDSIALFASGFQAGKSFDLWVMGRDGLWTKSFSIAIRLRPIVFVWPLCVWKKNEMLMEKIDKVYAMFKLDISTQKVSKVELPDQFDNYYIWRVFSYKESLFSIEGERDIPHLFQDIFQLVDA